MNAVLQAVAKDSLSLLTRSLALAVVYDDFDSHRRGMAFYEWLLQDLADDVQLTATWWRSSLLADLHVSHFATRAAGDADVIIVCFRGDCEPSDNFRQWVETWPPKEGHTAALVSLLDSSGALAAIAQWDSLLRSVARRRNMLYIPGPRSAPEQTNPRAAVVSANRCIEPYFHWGLNE